MDSYSGDQLEKIHVQVCFPMETLTDVLTWDYSLGRMKQHAMSS